MTVALLDVAQQRRHLLGAPGERFDAGLAGRPVLVRGNTQLLFGGMGRLSEASVINTKNKSHAVTAEVEVPASGVDGVVIAHRAGADNSDAGFLECHVSTSPGRR
mgnify:CR=1 FL=1